MKTRILLLTISLVAFCAATNVVGQTSGCDKDCVRTVRGLLKESYIGISLSWSEKSNNQLGDKVGLALLQIYKGKAIYVPDNIRTFLPVIEQAFKFPTMIENEADKTPRVTVRLLRRVKSRIKDHFLNREITVTLNSILFRDATQTDTVIKP